ncbi:MAG: Stealth CR1 domain-containing protein, partial [Muribaculaceae bacterium]|nr:Stealth CR1 domain-containing protein [Muribaculaceae bacterium]
MDIDLVYLWVDGSDPKWIAKRNACVGAPTGGGKHCEGRYSNHDELMYSLRSAERYAPWIRKIFIVTDDQVPSWLDTSNPKIQIVDHREILPAESLPCFNSVVIEHFLWRIPVLAEHFLYANDDMLFNRPVQPADFFAPDGLPIVRFNRRPMRRFTLWLKANVLGKKPSNYLLTIHNSALAVERHYGKYIGHKTHHNIDAYLKSDLESIYREFAEELAPTLANHVRADSDIQRQLYTYAALMRGRAHRTFVDQHTSMRFHIDNPGHYEKYEKFHTMLLCMNDSQ